MNDQSESRRNEAARWWQVWLDEIESPRPDLARAARAARQVSASKPSQAQLRQWLAAIHSDVEDTLTCEQCQAQLPDFIAAQVEMERSAAPERDQNPQMTELRAHLALCPYCMEAYADSTEWLRAVLGDTVPVSQSYPAFDFSFLSQSGTQGASRTATLRTTSGHNLATRIERAVAAGRQWLHDSAGGILVLFGPSLHSEPALAWAVKSADAGALLAQVVLSDEELRGWEITVAAFAQEEGAQEGQKGLCQLEVALYRGEVSLAGVSIRVVIDTQERDGVTDEGGVAIFDDVLIAQLNEVVVHVGLVTE